MPYVKVGGKKVANSANFYCVLCRLKVQSPLVIVDSFDSGKLSTVTRESTITREIHAKINIWSNQFIHCNGKIHHYRQEILTFQLEREKLFHFAHIAYACVVKTELFFCLRSYVSCPGAT